MRAPRATDDAAHDGLATNPEPASRRTPLIVALSMAGVVAVVGVAAWVVFDARRHVDGALGEGKLVIDDPSDCRTSLAVTTTCRGENSGFQECHCHFRAEGIPDPEICTAFLAGPDALPASHPDPAPAMDGGARGPCPENAPTGWQPVACDSFGIDAAMVCYRCVDDTRPESSRELVQAFDRSCDRGVVLKSCNEPLRNAAGP
jgi:hypothetical protein